MAFIRLSDRLKDDIILIRREHPAVTCFMKLTTPNETAAEVQKAMEKAPSPSAAPSAAPHATAPVDAAPAPSPIDVPASAPSPAAPAPVEPPASPLPTQEPMMQMQYCEMSQFAVPFDVVATFGSLLHEPCHRA